MATPPAITIYRGDTFTRTFLIGTKDPETGVVTGVNLTLYGDTWSSQLRTSEDSTDSISFTVDPSETTTGYVTLSLSSEDSAKVPTKGVWDLQISNTGQTPPIIRTFIKGTFSLTKDVTR